MFSSNKDSKTYNLCIKIRKCSFSKSSVEELNTLTRTGQLHGYATCTVTQGSTLGFMLCCSHSEILNF